MFIVDESSRACSDYHMTVYIILSPEYLVSKLTRFEYCLFAPVSRH